MNKFPDEIRNREEEGFEYIKEMDLEYIKEMEQQYEEFCRECEELEREQPANVAKSETNNP